MFLFRSGILCFLIFLCQACFNSDYTDFINRDRSSFFQGLSQSQLKTIKSFINDSASFPTAQIEVDNNFCCVWVAPKGWFPFSTLNKLFNDKGFPITYNRDSIKYVIILENEEHIVGKYTNGGEAIRPETHVNIINLETKERVLLGKFLGDFPPSEISGDRGYGQKLTDEEFFNEIVNHRIFNLK